MAASKIPQDVRVANSNLSKALDFYSSIDRWDLPNRFRVQDIDPVLFDHQIIDIKQYNAWEDQHLTPQQKNDIAKLIYERFKDDTDIATQNYFFVVERTSEGVDALAGAIGARAARSRNPQPPIKPQGISKGSNIKGIKVNWGQATTFINDRFEALQKSVGQLPKNKLAYDGPDMNYKSSTQKPLEPTKNQIEVRKYYPGSEPENSASGSASVKGKKASGEGKTPVPTKPGGGSDSNNFVNEHAKKHMYDPSRPSTKNKSQYGQDVDVKELRRETMTNPDKAYSNWPNPNNPNPNRITKYYKEFGGNISTPDTPTGSHRVFENLDNPRSNSHFPYVPRNKD